LGFEAYQVQLSPELKSQIKKLQKQNAIDKLPDYLRNAVSNEGYIQDRIFLDYSSMYRTCSDKADYEYRAKPFILGIGKQLILREFLIDMDYVLGFSSQKNNITHVKCGSEKDPIKDEKILKAIHDMITNRPPASAVITTRGDISIQNVEFKWSELFDNKKFQQCNEDILDYYGLPIVFIPSKNEGVNNTTVIIGLKPFAQSVETDREIFQEFLNVFCTEINKRNGFNEIPQTIYKHTNIRDDASLIKEMQFLADRGVLSFEDVCLEFDFDRDEQLSKKKFDWDNRDVEAPVIELSQGTTPMLQKKFEQELELKSKTVSNPDLNLPDNKQTKTKQKVGDG
jgi:hypothetical protein